MFHLSFRVASTNRSRTDDADLDFTPRQFIVLASRERERIVFFVTVGRQVTCHTRVCGAPKPATMRRRRDDRSVPATRNQCEGSCSHTLTSILASVAFVPVALSSRYPSQYDITTVLSAKNSRGSIGSLPFGLQARGGYQDTADYDIDEAVAFRVFCVANFDGANVERLQSKY